MSDKSEIKNKIKFVKEKVSERVSLMILFTQIMIFVYRKNKASSKTK